MVMLRQSAQVARLRMFILSYAGVKQGLGMLSRYLYVVTDDTSPDGAARSQLQVLDIKNKLVAGELTTEHVGVGGGRVGRLIF